MLKNKTKISTAKVWKLGWGTKPNLQAQLFWMRCEHQ